MILSSPPSPRAKDGYYVVGNFTDWAYKDEFKMTEGEDGIYTLATELTTLSRFKIVHVEGENVTWIPDGIGSDYVDIPENGTYTVCFDPKFSHSDWYCDCITIELISAADFKLGDVDGDGDVTVVDATFIQRYATFVDIARRKRSKNEDRSRRRRRRRCDDRRRYLRPAQRYHGTGTL